MIKIYGIPNCNTVKKARQWLTDHHIHAEFIDFKKTPPTSTQLTAWLKVVPSKVLVNRKSTTWRKLSTEQQQSCDQAAGAIAVLQAHSTLIKRPVLEYQGYIYVGFSDTDYATIFQKSAQS